jgi:hypothetical protein
VPEADRGREVEDIAWAGEGVRPGAAPCRAVLERGDPLDELDQRAVHPDRIPGLWAVPAPLEQQQVAAGGLGGDLADDRGDHCVVGPVDDEHRARDAPEQVECAVPVLQDRLRVELRGDEHLGVRLERPAHAVLDLLRRVRLREDLPEEEVREERQVPPPDVLVVERPTLVRDGLGEELPPPFQGGRRVQRSQRRTDEHGAGNSFRGGGGDDRSEHPASGDPG